jgi:hypothetical protein
MEHLQKLGTEMTPCAAISLKSFELRGCRKFAVPKKPGDFLEIAVLSQVLDGVAEIDQRIDFGHHLRDAGRVYDHAVQPTMDCGFIGHIKRV